MRFRARWIWVQLLWVALLVSSVSPVPAQAGQAPAQEPAVLLAPGAPPAVVQLGLAAPQISASWDSRQAEPVPFDLPVLYLRRGTEAAAPAERTLTLHLSGVPGGTAVEVEAVSWHGEPQTLQHHRQSTQIALPQGECTVQEPCVVEWTLDAAAESDLYRLTVRGSSGELLWENPDPERPDFAALDTWDVDVPGYTVRIYYGTLFPFARGERALHSRLSPTQVREFVTQRLAPLVAETWETQFQEWGFGPIHPEWDGDGIVEIIFTGPPFALFGGNGTYTAATYIDGTPYPERRIWMLPDHNTLQEYKSLEDGYRVLLAHEFFHLVQRSVVMSAGCPDHGLATVGWTNLFFEAQAKVVPGIQYPALELRRDHLAFDVSGYSSSAEQFLTRRLETSYADLEDSDADRYDMAIYWRFLYERYGSLAVFRAALEEMACRPPEDVPATMAQIMDATLARLDGPFGTYEESLVAFAQANYALRLDGAWCEAPLGACLAPYYDPHQLYAAPPLAAELDYAGPRLTYGGALPASFGMDMIEIRVANGTAGQPLQVVFRSNGARFSVRLWKLGEDGTRALTSYPETLADACSTECHYTVHPPEKESYARLAVIVVRVDPDEAANPIGSYQLAVDRAPFVAEPGTG